MKKWLIIAITVLVVVIAVVVAGLSKLGPIIKTAVNTYGPKMTKTEVHIDEVSISVFSGQVKVKNFFLGNTAGFQSPYAMKVGSIYIDVDEKTLTDDTLIIDRIEIVRPEIMYEKVDKTDNFKAILNNMKSTMGADRPARERLERKTKEKKIVIKDFIVRNGKINLFIPHFAGKSVGASLPNIHLKNIGGEKDGAPAGEVFREVFAEFYKELQSPSVMSILIRELKTLGIQSIETVGEVTKKVLGGVTNNAKRLLGK
jgi:hypothetical protein